MKKFFKKGLIALTLMLGMNFAAPQNASAYDWGEYKHGNVIHRYGLQYGTDCFIFIHEDGEHCDIMFVTKDGRWYWDYNRNYPF